MPRSRACTLEFEHFLLKVNLATLVLDIHRSAKWTVLMVRNVTWQMLTCVLVGPKESNFVLDWTPRVLRPGVQLTIDFKFNMSQLLATLLKHLSFIFLLVKNMSSCGMCNTVDKMKNKVERCCQFVTAHCMIGLIF